MVVLLNSNKSEYSILTIAYDGPNGIDWDNPWDIKSFAAGMNPDGWPFKIFVLYFCFIVSLM